MTCDLSYLVFFSQGIISKFTRAKGLVARLMLSFRSTYTYCAWSTGVCLWQVSWRPPLLSPQSSYLQVMVFRFPDSLWRSRCSSLLTYHGVSSHHCLNVKSLLEGHCESTDRAHGAIKASVRLLKSHRSSFSWPSLALNDLRRAAPVNVAVPWE